MCIKNRYYPLVLNTTTGKKFIMFNKPFYLNSREAIDDMFKSQEKIKDYYRYLDSLKEVNEETGEIEGFDFVKFVSVPCGMCRECLTDNSRQWAFRILKEAEQHDDNWFITFTYDDDHIPSNKMLDTEAIKNFNKKLKVYLKRKGLDSSFRFYGVGEYGGQTARPHYHVIYFGLPIPDLKFICKSSEGHFIFDSQFIKDVWNKGFITIEGVSIGSASYVARYCDKKKRLNKLEKLELKKKGIVPEFSRMSNRPGIGAAYLVTVLEKFNDGIYNSFVNGKSYSFPLYYNRKIKEILLGTDVLMKYEEYAKLKSSAKIAQNMELADRVGSLYYYNEYIDSLSKSKRKL